MRSPDHTRLSAQLPAIYQENAVSFAQVDAYLGLVDELSHAVVERLEDLLMGLGPDAVLRWPAELPFDAGADALLASYLAAYDDVAAWAGFVFPSSWARDEAGLTRRREFLARCARLWRRRGTPRGFLSWFGLYFGLQPSDAPYLLEHFTAPGPGLTGLPYTATLFVPSTSGFGAWTRRAEADEFVRRYAPAHVRMRVCFTDPGVFEDLAVLGSAPVLPENPGETDVEVYATAVEQQQRDLNALLCSVVSVVSHESGVHIHECINEGRSTDRIGVGLLPTDPEE
ncbi:hypothetical protein [Kocuria sabuli]|uniref:hypothetical protein n=1 Tax=Kocuria sabuli TaxID=3071448 RepID=UPI0034D4B039